VKTTTILLLLLALLAPGIAFAQEGKPEEQAPPAENPLPQETPEVEEPARAPQPPPTPAAPPMVTLGEFVVRAATGLKLPAPQGGFTPESAAWALVLKGVKVRSDLGSPLAEADAVGALTGLGYRIRTMTPSRVVSRDRFEILIESFFTGEVRPPASAPAATPAPTSPAAPPEGKP
jgi:hypothetical protein